MSEKVNDEKEHKKEGFFAKLMGKLDKKLEEKSKNSCCGGSDDSSKGSSCC